MAKADLPNRDRTRLRRLAELLALTALAVAQPLLDVTGRSADFFIFRAVTPADMWAVVAIVVLGPPLVLWLIELAAGTISEAAASALHWTFVAGLLALLAIAIGKELHASGAWLAVAAIALGATLAALARRRAGLRQVLLYASPAPLVVVLVFAVSAPAGALLRSADSGGVVTSGSPSRTPVVVIFLDELPIRALLGPDGRVDERLFPNFARLAAASTWYPNATGVSGWTPIAVPPMLTGRFPRTKVAPAHVELPENLFTALRARYDVRAFESITQLCPRTVCGEVAAGRATGLRPLLGDLVAATGDILGPAREPAGEGEAFAERAAGRDPAPPPGKGKLDVRFRLGEGRRDQPARLSAFLAGLDRPAGRPKLHFLHLLLPHLPWRHLPSGRRYGDHPKTFPLARAKEDDSLRRNDEPRALTLVQQRVLLQLAYLDGLMGRLIDRMRRTGLWDEALLVVTADHGLGLTPGQTSRILDADNAADLAYVPLFVRTPGQRRGRVDPRNAMVVDLLPTIADGLDVRLPFDVDGVSLLGKPRPTLEKVWFDNPGEAKQIDGGRWAAVARSGLAHRIARPQSGPAGLFALGPAGDLVGRRVADLSVGATARARAKSGDPEAVERVDLDSGQVPALVWGDLDRPPARRPTSLAIELNGTIAGVAAAAPSRLDGSWHFAGMAADRYFVDGRNRVRLHALEGRTLRPIRWAR